jgi:hypothetical protein
VAEIRRVPVPRPAGAGKVPPLPPPPAHPGGGSLPFPTGQVGITPNTQQELMKLGWRPGDPIPGDFGRVIAEVQARVQKEKEAAGEALASQGQQNRPRIGRLVNISELPPTEQQQLRDYLREHKESVARAALIEQAQATETARLEEDVESGVVPPAVADNLATMAQTVRQQGAPEAVIVDDRIPPDLNVPEGKQVGGTLGVPLVRTPKPLPPRTPAAPSRPAPTTPESPTPAATTPTTPECPRCGYDCRIPFEGKPSQEDIERFSVAMLALQVFRKKYQLLGGKCVLTFRGLTSQDVILVNKQLGYDVRAAKIIGDGEYLTALMEYRLVLSVQRVEVQGHLAVDVPSVDEYAKLNPKKLPADPSKETILTEMHADFYSKYVTSESLRRVIGAKHREFQRLNETLEAMMLDPNFTAGIALPA